MNGLAVLIPIALLLGLGGLAAFFWAVRSGQFDDLEGAALRILIELDEAPAATAPALADGPRPATGPRSAAPPRCRPPGDST